MGELRRHRSHHHESRIGRILRSFQFEIIALLLALIGGFLLVDRWNLRHTASRWLDQSVDLVGERLARLDQAIARLVSQTSAVELAGFVLVLLAIFALFMRLRWRLMHSPQLALLRCPRCGGDIHRVHRTLLDRLIRWLAPTRRYRCANPECHWEGLRVTQVHATRPKR